MAEQPTDADLRDAAIVRAVATALRDWEASTGRRGSTKPLREAIWFYWQSPRLPRPRIRGKYPAEFLWTADARDAYRRDPKGAALVMEHTEPISVVIGELIQQDRPDAEVAVLLADRLACVVVTRDEDRRITAAGYGVSAPGSDGDPYARYRAAGISVEGIAPLARDGDA